METTAWVESPLQLLGAIEHAALEPTRSMTIIPRTGDVQLEHTASHLADHIANSVTMNAQIGLDRRILPSRVFTEGSSWVVGDAYSGQVQARLDRVEPGDLTLVDDGAITRRLARQLHAGEPLLRPNSPRLFGALRHELASRTTRRLRRLALDGRLAVTTFLPMDDPAVIALGELGARVISHQFDVTRLWGERASMVPVGARIVLGTARVVDGLDEHVVALERLERCASAGPVTYLPHRREPRWFLSAVARLGDVTVVEPRFPIELALAGTGRPLEILSGLSTAAETLPIVLRGTDSTVVFETEPSGADR